MLQKLHAWHRKKTGLLAFGLVELAAAYGFVSLAIDRGSLWYYLLTLILFVGSLQNLVKLIGSVVHGKK